MSQKRLRLEDEPFYLVRSLAGAVPAGHVIAVHAHGWHQLIYACSGVMQVWTERGAWVVPPHWAVWVPAGMRHGIRFAAASALRTLYVDPGAGLVVPTGCSVVGVSALLRALIERAVENGALDRRVAAEAAMALLILSECVLAEAPPFALPQPESAAMRQVAAVLVAAGKRPKLAAVAHAAGMSLRALERRFVAETGMAPGVWRRQAGLLAALEVLAAGAPLKRAALVAGYATESAFVAAFRASFGTTPGRYFQASQAPASEKPLVPAAGA